MAIGLLLVALGVLCRLVPHPYGFVPMGAICLFAAARLPRRWAWAVPLAAMALADVVLDYHWGVTPDFSVMRATIYGTYLATFALGALVRRDAGPATRAATALGASALFYLTTNFAVWQGGGMYPRDAAGLLECYVAALPFFGNSIAADLLGSGALFGLDAYLARRAKPAVAAELA